MADPPADPDSREQTGTPRWVKVFGIITLIVILLFVIVLLVRGPGGHGPGMHGSLEIGVSLFPVLETAVDATPLAGGR